MKLDPRTKLFLAVVANGMIFSAPFVYSLLMVVVASILLLLEGKWKFICTFFFVYLSAGFFFGQAKNLDIGTSGTIILASLFLMYRIMPACAVLYYVITTTMTPPIKSTGATFGIMPMRPALMLPNARIIMMAIITKEPPNERNNPFTSLPFISA